jgi:hypothetical protein
VHAQAGHEDELVAALELVVPVLGEDEGTNRLNQPCFFASG